MAIAAELGAPHPRHGLARLIDSILRRKSS
jgi:hypothetical protein